MEIEIAGRRFPEAAMAPEAIKARVLLIAADRELPNFDVERAVKAAARRGDYLVDFALTHGISVDWLIYGDIRGLKSMKHQPRAEIPFSIPN